MPQVMSFVDRLRFRHDIHMPPQNMTVNPWIAVISCHMTSSKSEQLKRKKKGKKKAKKKASVHLPLSLWRNPLGETRLKLEGFIYFGYAMDRTMDLRNLNNT